MNNLFRYSPITPRLNKMILVENKTATIITTAGGRVSRVKVTEGDKVKSGAYLARIEAEKAQSTLDVAKLNEKISREQYARTKKQFAKENISKVMVDNAHLAWLNSKKSLIDARKMVRGAYSIAPMSGVITTRHIEVNDELAPGQPTFTVSQVSKLKVVVGIPERDIVGVTEGNMAKVTFDVYPDREWEGTITRLGRELAPGSRTFRAEVTISNKDNVLKPGLTAKTKVTRQKLIDQIIVPTEIIVTRGINNYVMVAKDGVAHRKAVTLGSSNALETIVTSGIEAGEELILEGSQMVTDGTPITIKKL